MKKYRNPDQLQMIKEMLLEGRTLNEIGVWCGLTRERIRQIRRRWLSELDNEVVGKAVQTQENKKERLLQIQAKYGRSIWALDDIARAHSNYFIRKKQNVKQSKWEFSITMNDIEWNSHCPVLGVELDWFAEVRSENSPSLDRIDTQKGYIPGNVQIVSWRANRIKNDGTADEHRLIAEYLDKYVCRDH